MPPAAGGELADAFREIAREFKSLQQLAGKPSGEQAGLSRLDVDHLATRLEQLRGSLDECLAEIDSQRRESLLAAGGARDFYRALGDALAADAHALRRREDEINAIDDPNELTRRADQSEEETEQLSKGLSLKSTVADIGSQFQRLEEALKESAINCAKARERAAALREELEEAKRREEERRRQEAEEAERRRQEELRRRQAAEAAAAKAAAEEAERQRRREAEDDDDGEGGHRRKSSSRRRSRGRAEAEERRKREAEAAAAAAAAEEAERRWRPVVFSAEFDDTADAAAVAAAADFEYACAVRAPDGAVKPDDFRCSVVPLDQADVGSIPPGDELVSCVVRFEPAGLTRVPLTGGGGEGRRHWYFMLPHCAQRQTARETVVYIYQDGRWHECPSTETHIDGLEFQTRWVETRITKAAVTAVAVNKLKTDRFHVGKPGIRFCSSVDNRICLTVPEDALKIQLDQSLEVQPIDSTTLASIKSQLPKETHGLLTCSSIIQHTSISKNTLRPVTFNFPLPLNPAGAKKPRPGTAANPAGRPGGEAAAANGGRPMTAKPKASQNSDEDDEFVVLLGCDGHRRGGGGGGSGWTVLEDLDIDEEPGKDIVGLRSARFYDRRFIAFRVKPDFNSDTAHRICEAIEKSLEDKLACFVLRQKSDNLTEVSLALTATSRLDRTLKLLQEAGYDYDGASGGIGGGGGGGGNGSSGISEDIRVRERQPFRLRFRGNIVGEDDDPDRPSEFVLHFNSQMKNRLQLSVTERDRFAQRALDQFRGFLEVATDVAVQKPVKDAKKGSGHQTVTVIEEVIVAKMLICVPKSEEELRVKSPRVTPFVFKSKDAVTMEYLRDLAEHVRDNWELLADKLEVSKKRCSVIKRTSDSQETQAYDMLITWVKKLPVLKNKAMILCRALHAAGYSDLAASLRDAERDRRQRHQDQEENGGYYD